MNDRVKQVRKTLKLTQTEFGQKLGVTDGAITLIENGKRNVTEQMTISICREFGVNYDWLKNGVEPMMVPHEYIKKAKVDDILDGDNEFVKQVFYGLADMPDEWWDMAEKVLRTALDAKKDR